MGEWRKATTFGELCGLNAQFLESKIDGITQSDIDPETEELAPFLAECNRLGFFTTFSQPGMPMEDGWAQRAAVSGYALEPVARRLYCLTLETDLIVLAFPPGQDWGYQIPIATNEFHPNTWCGSTGGSEVTQQLGEHLTSQATLTLSKAWEVIVIDPVWGRQGYLWPRLVGAMRGDPTDYHSEPAPGLGLDADFLF